MIEPDSTTEFHEWKSPEHALAYLRIADEVPHRIEGEETLLAEISADSRRVLDLGTGDGRLIALILSKCLNAQVIGLDFSPPMLEAARKRFSGREQIRIEEHDLGDRLPDFGKFDAIVSSFAIHHLTHERKREIYGEIYECLNPGGVFCNLEHVASPTSFIEERFWLELNLDGDGPDPSNKLLDVHTQLVWLRELGFEDVDCYWKWRELALLIGFRRI